MSSLYPQGLRAKIFFERASCREHGLKPFLRAITSSRAGERERASCGERALCRERASCRERARAQRSSRAYKRERAGELARSLGKKRHYLARARSLAKKLRRSSSLARIFGNILNTGKNMKCESDLEILKQV